MPRKVVKLPSRYHESPHFLNFVKTVETELAKDKFVYELKDTDYVRFILKPQPEELRGLTHDEIISVDPPGGPFMTVGDTNIINGMKLTHIEDMPDGVYLIFEQISV